MLVKSLDKLNTITSLKKPKRIVVVAAHDITVINAIRKAIENNIIEPIFIGCYESIRNICKEINFNINNYEIIDVQDETNAAEIATNIISQDKADILMKGLIPTAIFLRPILSKDKNLLTAKLLSHLAIAELPNYHKLIGITDAAINIHPGIEEKIEIINNSVRAFKKLSISHPKIALICPIEKENPKIESTVHATIIKKKWLDGNIMDCIIDGPLALDNALSKEASDRKNIISNVAGDADILIAPSLDAGNILYKSVTYLAGGTTASVVLGAKFPIILTSRSDSVSCKFNSIALAVKLMTNE
jgi:phosphate butyryltransferase